MKRYKAVSYYDACHMEEDASGGYVRADEALSRIAELEAENKALLKARTADFADNFKMHTLIKRAVRLHLGAPGAGGDAHALFMDCQKLLQEIQSRKPITVESPENTSDKTWFWCLWNPGNYPWVPSRKMTEKEVMSANVAGRVVPEDEWKRLTALESENVRFRALLERVADLHENDDASGGLLWDVVSDCMKAIGREPKFEEE